MQRSAFFEPEITQLIENSDRVKRVLFDDVAHNVGGEQCSVCHEYVTMGDWLLG
jgi:hypothetical protein